MLSRPGRRRAARRIRSTPPRRGACSGRIPPRRLSSPRGTSRPTRRCARSRRSAVSGGSCFSAMKLVDAGTSLPARKVPRAAEDDDRRRRVGASLIAPARGTAFAIDGPSSPSAVELFAGADDRVRGFTPSFRTARREPELAEPDLHQVRAPSSGVVLDRHDPAVPGDVPHVAFRKVAPGRHGDEVDAEALPSRGGSRPRARRGACSRAEDRRPLARTDAVGHGRVERRSRRQRRAIRPPARSPGPSSAP